MVSAVTRPPSEGRVAVTGGEVWYRIDGAEHDAIPLLTLHGGPGFTPDSLAPLEALADERPVVFYDQLGAGRSDQPDDPSLWRVERFVKELGQLRAAALSAAGSGAVSLPGALAAFTTAPASLAAAA